MRTVGYALKGKDVPQHLVGTVINLQLGENYREAEQLTEKGETDVVEKFNDGRVIAIQGLLRTKASGKKVDGKVVFPTAAELQKIADDYRYTVREEGEGPKASKPQTIAKNSAADAGTKLFERCLANPKFLKQMLDAGVVEQEKYDTWLANRQPQATATEAVAK
jgi:hypothetical protein